MSGLCGWLRPDLPPDRSGPTLRSMLARSAFHTDEVCCMRHAAGASVGVTSLGAGNDVHQDDTTLAAIEGRPLWNDPELGRLAGERGPAFALARGFRDKGVDVLADLRGSYSLAVLLPAKQEALLAVDRLGTRPLAYALDPLGLVFGATLDSVRAYPSIEGRIDPQAIFDYLYFNMIPSPGTVYRGLQKLEPAQYLHYQGGRTRRAHHWRPVFRESSPGSAAALTRSLHETLRAAVRRHHPERSAAAFLSGGIDSSTVCGVLREVLGQPTPAYSIGFDVPGYDEMDYARIAARHFALDGHEYYVTPSDVVHAIPTIARAYDEPFGNSSALAVYYCARRARADGVHTMYAGDGGDEIFAGNQRYVKQKVFEYYGRLPAALRRWVIEPMFFSFPGGDRLMPIRKARSYIRQATVPLPDRLETYNLLHMLPLAEIFEADFLASVDTQHPLELLRAAYGGARAESSLNRMLYLDWKFTLADNDLRKVSRMCEIAGIDAVYPMLDDDIVELSTRVPTDLKIKGLRLRHFFKEAMRDFLPREVIEKRKHGFGLPFGEWLRSTPALQSLADDSLRALRRRGYVRSDFIDRVLAQHRHEHAGFYGTMLWVLMMLELWLQNREALGRLPVDVPARLA